jgi:neutral ceramidase
MIFLRRLLLLSLVLSLPVLLPNSGFAQAPSAKVLRAGAATSNITPPLGERVIGGFAPFPSTNIHDELHARCLVLDNGETKLAIVICDNLGIRKDVYTEVRELVGQETDLSPENILLAATHTHSATPSSSETYRPLLVRRIADCIRRANQNLEPAKIGWSSVDEPSEVFNRRWYVTDPELTRNPFGGVDKVRMNPPRGSKVLIKPAGPIDPEVSFISVQTTEGRPLALLGNYSLHYVGGVNRGEVSSDYFGIFSNRIGELIGAKEHYSHPPFVGMMSNGTSGDINNINFPILGRSVTNATRR